MRRFERLILRGGKTVRKKERKREREREWLRFLSASCFVEFCSSNFESIHRHLNHQNIEGRRKLTKKQKMSKLDSWLNLKLLKEWKMKAPFFLLLCFCLKFGTVLSGSFQPVVVEADVGVLYEDLVSSGNSLPPTTQVTTSLYNPLTSSERALLLTSSCSSVCFQIEKSSTSSAMSLRWEKKPLFELIDGEIESQDFC